MTPALADGDKLCLRMQRIRNRMHAKVDLLRIDAQSILDWRYYVAQFPWWSVAIAAAVGFWRTPGPRVTQTVKLDEHSMDELVNRGAVNGEPPRSTASWLQPLGGMAFNLATKALLGYVSQRLMAPPPATVHEPAETSA